MRTKEKEYLDLTRCKIVEGLVLFALPMIAGDLLQQFYNITDTLIVGKFIGSNALAAVGSAYSLMTFLTSVFLGLSMGAGVLFSIELGKQNMHRLRSAIFHAFFLVMVITAVINILLFILADPLLHFLSVPDEIYEDMKAYLLIIFTGLMATSLYNYFACLLRAVGNSVIPLVFLGSSALMNIGLDLLFVPVFQWGIQGAAAATVISQYVSGIGISLYFLMRCRRFVPKADERRFDAGVLRDILGLSCMNFGILLVQRLVDSFGTITMAAFAAGVKIDTFAYLPVQDFGNAFSIFISQNCGAGNMERQRKGFRAATLISLAFSALISFLVVVFAGPLMRIFVRAEESAVLASGVRYLRIEGAFYIGIGCLFLLYGLYRGIGRPGISVILTVVSLGTRVVLAYLLAPVIGETGIWMAVPIGWFLADMIGYGWYFLKRSDWFQ